MTDRVLHNLSQLIGYDFSNIELLRQALQHPSFTHENSESGEHNQRLEFLGDAVLGLVVAEALVRRFSDAREGQLTRWRAALVSEKPLARAAKDIGLGDLVMLGKGEELNGGRERSSLLCDTYEAVVGAAFLDGGLAAARTVVETTIGEKIDHVSYEDALDHKSKLQEKLQAEGAGTPVYSLIATTGPDHNRQFEMQITLGDTVLGVGWGSSKKAAEQHAARQALKQMKPED